MSLDIDADIRKLRKELSINDVALENIRISGKFLQHAVAAGLTLYEIAMIISRSKLDKPSQLEIMCAQAEAMAVNELKGRRRVHPSSPESVRRRRRRGGAPKTQDSHEMAMLSTKSLPQVTSRQTFYSSQDDSSLDDNISILVDRCDSGTDQPPRGMELSRNSLRPASQPSPNGSSARSRIDYGLPIRFGRRSRWPNAALVVRHGPAPPGRRDDQRSGQFPESLAVLAGRT
eukprot:611284_1